MRARDGVMRFHPKVARDTATLLLVCVFIIVIVGLALSSGAVARTHVKAISAVAAVLLLTVYLVWVIPYVRCDERPAQPSERGAAAPAGRARAARRRRRRRRASSPTGSSTRSRRRSTSCTSRRPSPAS